MTHSDSLLEELLDELLATPLGVEISEPEAAAEATAARIVDALCRLELDNLQTPRGRRAFAMLARFTDGDVMDHITEALLFP